MIVSPKSLRVRMTRAFCLAAVAYLIIAWSGLTWYASHSADQQADRLLKTASTGLTMELRKARSDADMQRRLAHETEEFRSDGVVFALVSHNGTAIENQSEVERSLIAGKGWKTSVTRAGQDIYIVGVPWKPYADFKDHVILLLLVTLPSLVIGTVGSWIVVGRTLRPIALLSDQAIAASTENPGVQLREPSSDSEIVRLVATLNGLLARVSEVAETKAKFYSAASHELRTPLQALSGHLELALQRERSPQDYRRVIEEAHLQTERLVTLVTDLLLLYRLESTKSQPQLHTGDLAGICRQTLSLYEPLIKQRSLHLKTNLPVNAEFCAPLTHANVIVRNLVENAVKYAEKGSEISVDLSATDGWLRLHIFNKCSHPFEGTDGPVADGHSEPSCQNGGFGLGLTICHAIADANSWQLIVEKEADGVHAIFQMGTRYEDC